MAVPKAKLESTNNSSCRSHFPEGHTCILSLSSWLSRAKPDSIYPSNRCSEPRVQLSASPPINYCKAALCLPKSTPSPFPPHTTYQQSQLGHQTCHRFHAWQPLRDKLVMDSAWPCGHCRGRSPFSALEVPRQLGAAQDPREGWKSQDKLGYTIKGYTHDLLQNYCL